MRFNNYFWLLVFCILLTCTVKSFSQSISSSVQSKIDDNKQIISAELQQIDNLNKDIQERKLELGQLQKTLPLTASWDAQVAALPVCGIIDTVCVQDKDCCSGACPAGNCK